MSRWFRHYLPIVVDLETGGVDPYQNPILEIACVALDWSDGVLCTSDYFHAHVIPFLGGKIEEKSLEVTGIIPDHPFRFAVDELTMLTDLSGWLGPKLKKYRCRKAILVGHNAHFDLSFLNQSFHRHPQFVGMFHKFSVIDTVTLAMVMYGETVLAQALHKAGLPYDEKEAHAALYDAKITADLFCHIVNHMGYLKRKVQ
jgi:ribonuclease T